MKKITSALCFLTLSILLLTPSRSYARQLPEKEYIGKDLYCVTSIEEYSSYTNQKYNIKTTVNTKTASKTVTYENSKGDILWYVKVTGTFSYNGTSSSCILASATGKL